MNKGEEFLTRLEVLKKSSGFLRAKGVPSPKCDSEWLVSTSLKIKRMELYLHPEEIVEEQNIREIRSMIVRRGKREPLQHILGSVNFAGFLIKSDERALVPRPETESLVEYILNRIPDSFEGKILDLGTGSGAILIALCSSLPSSFGIGTDRCNEALALAEENVRLLNLQERVVLRNLDWHQDKILDDDISLIVANPPYLDEEEWESAQPEVKSFDPKSALVAEDGGFYDLRKIIACANETLATDGLLALEFGICHADQIEAALRPKFKDIEILKDLSRYRRFAIAKKS